MPHLTLEIYTNRALHICDEATTQQISPANKQFEQGVCHIMPSLYTLKSILRQKKNYGNSNISPCKNIIFKKTSKRNKNPSRYYNSLTSFKFQHKPKYQLSKILI
jgi:hypothetical protein